jgi:hypothetical protein
MRPLLAVTGQCWKRWSLGLASTASVLVCSFGVRQGSPVLTLAAVGAGFGTFGACVLSIRCPRCSCRLLWRALRTQPGIDVVGRPLDDDILSPRVRGQHSAMATASGMNRQSTQQARPRNALDVGFRRFLENSIVSMSLCEYIQSPHSAFSPCLLPIA